MKRLRFIRNMSMVGIGIGLTSWKFAGAKSTTRAIKIPAASVHIPHGNFSTAKLNTVYLEEMDLTMSLQRFMRNGILECDEDMILLSFSRQNHDLMICVGRNELEMIGAIPDIQASMCNGEVILKNATAELTLNQKLTNAIISSLA